MATTRAAKQPAKKTTAGSATRRNTATTRSLRAQAQAAGPLYLVLSDSYIDQRLVREGEQVTYYGLPGRALRPLNDEAKARKSEVLAINRDESLSHEAKQEKLRLLSDEWNGVVSEDAADEDFEVDDDALEAAEAERLRALEEADRRAKLTASGEANKGADAGKGGIEAAEAAKRS
jgi:hypothetical protein